MGGRWGGESMVSSVVPPLPESFWGLSECPGAVLGRCPPSPHYQGSAWGGGTSPLPSPMARQDPNPNLTLTALPSPPAAGVSCCEP